MPDYDTICDDMETHQIILCKDRYHDGFDLFQLSLKCDGIHFTEVYMFSSIRTSVFLSDFFYRVTSH